MIRVKICGLRDLESARVAAEAGADYVGFVFASTRRYVAPETVRAIVRELPSAVGKVGLFVNADAATVRQIVADCRLDYAQLCGDESPEYCQTLGVPAIKSLRVRGAGISDEVAAYAGEVAWCHLDSFVPNAYGGTGTAFDWRLAREVAARHLILLAGGLNPDNVGEAIRTASPWGVDVSSGVETNGVKDPAKIVAFIQAARAE